MNTLSSRNFWEDNPVASAAIGAKPGSPEFFKAFDALRERDDCEPPDISEKIHGYSQSKGLRILDFGCGNGYVLSRYARNGAEVHGIDVTQKAVELSRKRFEVEGLKGSFRRSDCPLPYPSGHFDIVCSMGVLHHIEDPTQAVSELHRVLKPGGQLIAMFYNRNSWNNLVLLRLKRLLHPAYRGLSQHEAVNRTDGAECPYARVYSKDEARELLKNFDDLSFFVNTISYKQLFMPGAEKILPPLSGSRLASALGWCLYINGTKR